MELVTHTPNKYTKYISQEKNTRGKSKYIYLAWKINSGMPYNVLALKYHIIYHITSLVQTFPHINHPLFSLNTSDRRNDYHNVHKHINSSKLSKVTHQEEDIKYCHNQRRQTYHKITKILTPSHLKTLKQLLFTPLENHCSNLWHGVCFI